MTADSAPTWTRGPGRAGPCAPRNTARPSRGHGDRGGGIARGAHRPGTSHAAAGPGGSRTARTSQHGDPLTQPQGPAPETPRRTTSLRQPSRTRGSQPRELWRYRLLGGDLHALAGASPPPRWSPGRRLPTLTQPRGQVPTRASQPAGTVTLTQPREPGPHPLRGHGGDGDPHTAAGAGTPRWDQGTPGRPTIA